MRVIVCGGRNYTDARAIYAALDLLRPEVVISGCQTGADTIALNWASERGVETAKYPYLVDFGHSGGSKRNQQMLEEGKPDLVLAFPGGRGTADMVRRAKEAGIRVVCQKS
jgi:predicted Rossmann-fold nucleotide-binding protein